MQPAAVLGALPLAYAPLLLEHGGESEGAQSGDTDFVTSGGESELSGEDNGGDAFANAVLALVDHSAGSSVTPPMTPRLQSILGSMAISPVRSVRSSMEAVAMDVDTFGESTEAVRSRAIDEAVAGSTHPPPPTQMAVVLSLPSSAALTAGAPMVMERAVPPAGAQLLPMVLERAVLPAGKQPFPIVHASTSSAVLESEDRAAALAADELMRVTPVELAFICRVMSLLSSVWPTAADTLLVLGLARCARVSKRATTGWLLFRDISCRTLAYLLTERSACGSCASWMR